MSYIKEDGSFDWVTASHELGGLSNAVEYANAIDKVFDMLDPFNSIARPNTIDCQLGIVDESSELNTFYSGIDA